MLRTPVPADAAPLTAAVGAAYEHLRHWMVWASPHYSQEDAIQWIEGKIGGRTETGDVPLLIVDTDDQLLGAIGLHAIDRLNDRATLGYWLRPEATGAGVATKATRLLADYALSNRAIHRVEITMSVENEPSRRVAERAGATYEGVAVEYLKHGDRFHDAHRFYFLANQSRH